MQRSREARAIVAILLSASGLTAAGYPTLFFQKGVNFTAEGPRGYSPEFAAPMLDQLAKYGVNAIALVPYGFSRLNDPVIRYGGDNMERSQWIEAVAGQAHKRGIKILLKPHLWARGGFPGTIEFAVPADRAKWFDQYKEFIQFYAVLAARIHADVFCVGTELSKMTPYEAEWRKVIAHVREVYRGPLVYAAAQGPEFESLTFWDALDYIGLDNYYPLPDDLSMTAIVAKVEAVQRSFKKPVIFTEAGFASVEAPHREPWSEPARRPFLADQARCYEAVFQAFYRKPWFQGIYWWKVGTNGFGGVEDGSHTPWGKPAMDVVKKWYSSGAR